MKILFTDVGKAHLNAECDDQIYVVLPEEVEAPGKCGLLKRWLYGMRGGSARMGETLHSETGRCWFRLREVVDRCVLPRAAEGVVGGAWG